MGRRSQVLGAVVVLLLWSAPLCAGIFTTYYRNEATISGLRAENPHDTKVYEAPPGWFYEVAWKGDTEYILRFERRSEAARYREYSSKADTDTVKSDGYYRVARVELEKPLRQLFVQGLDPGIVAVPFKYRPKVPGAPAQLTGEATVGAAIGLRYATDLLTTTLEPVIAFGISQVSLGENAGDAAKSVQALTLAAGLQVDLIGRFAMGFVVGWDKIPGTDGDAWPYQGRPWVALSLSAGMFNRSEKQQTKGESLPQAPEEDAKKPAPRK